MCFNRNRSPLYPNGKNNPALLVLVLLTVIIVCNVIQGTPMNLDDIVVTLWIAAFEYLNNN